MEKEKDIKKKLDKKEKPAKSKLSFTGNKKELEETKSQVKELEDKYLRLFAEFENFKKRVRKENEILISTASEIVIKAILPVLDDFERAKKASEDENSNEKFSEGVTLVFEKLFSTLKTVGLEPIDSNDSTFNPEEHEAIAELLVADENSKNKIIDTVEKGYKLNSKIIRFPKVVVGK
jgi:molecular chaperone GrpE